MPRHAALPLLLAAGMLAGCGILVDRYDSTRPSFTAEYRNETELASVIRQANEYCAVYERSAERRRTVTVDGEPYAVFACR